ncbi:secreted protein [Candidatus Magnetobacterium bavaricum]|uniref:Secreted protein n=1 Tax=Candidatus Magnetobacterium bavaricum TaxID=29290 RepID=A0A0F3GYA7_9BACT|nr:secreted protein [Candidatus Magnetobacterium bavaricum]
MRNLRKSLLFVMMLACLLAFMTSGNEAFAKSFDKQTLMGPGAAGGDIQSDFLFYFPTAPVPATGPAVSTGVWYLGPLGGFAPIAVASGAITCAAPFNDPEWVFLGTGNFDIALDAGTGSSDLLYRHRNTSQFMIVAMTGAAFACGGATPAGENIVDSSWQFRGIADVDGNGIDDVVVQLNSGSDNTNNYEVAFLSTGAAGGVAFAANPLTAAQRIPTHIVTLNNDDWTLIATGNFDGDAVGTGGYDDLMFWNTNTASSAYGRGVVLQMGGAGIVIGVVQLPVLRSDTWRPIGEVAVRTDNGKVVTSYLTRSSGNLDRIAGSTTDDIIWVNKTTGQLFPWRFTVGTVLPIIAAPTNITDLLGGLATLPVSIVAAAAGSVDFVGFYQLTGWEVVPAGVAGLAATADDILLQSPNVNAGTYPTHIWGLGNVIGATPNGTQITYAGSPLPLTANSVTTAAGITVPTGQLLRGIQQRCAKSNTSPFDSTNCNY